MTAVVRGRMVDVPTHDGTADAYFVRPDDGVAHPAALVWMDAFGLRPSLKEKADRLAAAGYAVLVPNAFYREGRAPLLELPPYIGADERSELVPRLIPMIQRLTPVSVMRDAEGYLAWLATCPEAADGPVGVTGYCMGAGLALRTAAAYPDRVAAAAGFHGSHLASEAPDSPHLAAERITAELYFGHGDQDPTMPPEQIERLASALTAAGVRHRAEVYTGAAHGYTQTDTVSYDEQASERHWDALLDLFGRNLHVAS
ncbi:dienelactone hydrolase family protein [Yinghuangia sp. YIM S09857]|uniref:dienelactone hydrolase family protein n=1 Tax=Yinghuangia sp. YIM S09857 TaxID=3436929 RepID=UPI003F538E7E